jgi:hypothetical protein
MTDARFNFMPNLSHFFCVACLLEGKLSYLRNFTESLRGGPDASSEYTKRKCYEARIWCETA